MEAYDPDVCPFLPSDLSPPDEDPLPITRGDVTALEYEYEQQLILRDVELENMRFEVHTRASHSPSS